MCPAITEDPISPGRGLPVYQPATEVDVGTWRVRWAVRPSLTSLERTPMAGMVRATGAGAAVVGEGSGAGATDPDGTGTDARAGWSAAAGWPVSMTSPAAPRASTSSPQTRVATANGRRWRRPRGGPPRDGPPRGGAYGACPYCDFPAGGPRCPCRGPPSGFEGAGRPAPLNGRAGPRP